MILGHRIKEPTFSRGKLPEIEKDIDCWEN